VLVKLPGFAAAALLAAGLIAAPGSAAPPAPGNTTTREFGNGPERNEVAAIIGEVADANALRAAPATKTKPQGYPRRHELREYPENPADKSIKLGLVPYHGIAPRLNDLQDASDRVSAEVAGHSALGRDLYLVTVTAPETAAETARQDRWRALIEDTRWRRGGTRPSPAITRHRSGSTRTSTATSGRAPTAPCG
jgi:hypothetical protein